VSKVDITEGCVKSTPASAATESGAKAVVDVRDVVRNDGERCLFRFLRQNHSGIETNILVKIICASLFV